jgi:hypothetical protein
MREGKGERERERIIKQEKCTKRTKRTKNTFMTGLSEVIAFE